MAINPEPVFMPMRSLEPAVFIAILLAVCLLVPEIGRTSPIKKDEEVVFFPTCANFDERAGEWIISIHGWIFEREEDSTWRKAVLKGLAKKLELGDDADKNRFFRERGRMFLVDNERWKKPDIRIAGNTFTAERSKANGHFKCAMRIGRDEIENHVQKDLLYFKAVTREGDDREFSGEVRMVGAKGVSVISDIDDTIKESAVLDRKELLANTFLREYRPVPKMAEVYREWESGGAVFHYVSSSPWQLYPFLSEFMNRQGFPEGGFHLKLFRVKDRSFFNLFTSSTETKPPVIQSIFDAWPERRFVMVGDSGENDPEIYAAFASNHPDRVLHIFIRKVAGADNGKERFDNAFDDVPEDLWTVFEDPDEIRAAGVEIGR